MSIIQARRHSFLPQSSCEGEESLPVEAPGLVEHTFRSNAYVQQEHTPVAGTVTHNDFYPRCASAIQARYLGHVL
jgi:hypothetical protein